MLIRITDPPYGTIDMDKGIFPPILRYMTGWPASKIFKYCDWKGWTYTITDTPEAHKPKPLTQEVQNG